MENVYRILLQIWDFITSWKPSNHKYVISVQSYSAGQPIISNFAEVTFFNAGTSTFIVNGLPLSPGTQLSINGNEYEVDTTNYFISFSGAGVNQGFIITKQFVE